MTPEVAPKKRRVPKLIWFVFFGCLGMTLLAAIFGRPSGNGAAEPTAVRAATVVAPTATSAPTLAPTAAPSETPVTVAEATPVEATAVPSPTADPAAMSPEEAAYASEMTGALKTVGSGLTIVQTQLERLGDGSAASDANWAEKMGMGMEMVRLGVKGIREITAPTRFELVHGQLLLASDHYENSMGLLEEGLTGGDLVKVEEARAAMTRAGNAVELAQELWAEEMGDASSAGEPAGPTAAKDANLRAGPGTGFAKVGSVAAGAALKIVGTNETGDWFLLADGGWIAAFLVASPPGAVPVAAVIPTEPTQPPASAQRSQPVVVLPSAELSSCDCSADLYNCDDFPAFDAQACYLRCKAAGVGDIHRLDGNNNGTACEWKY